MTTNRSVAYILASFALAACGDASPCGEDLDGATCENDDGVCADLVCVDGDWSCPDGYTQTSLTEESCQGGGS